MAQDYIFSEVYLLLALLFYFLLLTYLMFCEQISLDNFKSGRLHTLITSAFSHIDIEHIVSNMIGLYFFGSNV